MPKESKAMVDDGSVNGGAGLPLGDVGRLVELLARSGVGEIRVRQGELEITVKAKVEAAAPPAPVRANTVPQNEVVVEAPLGSDLNGLHAVRSPVVGTFYRAPAPEEEPFVEVGDRISEGQTLCIVEAMKLMNEIPSDVTGEVVEVLAENAGGVEYDQPLFYIKPE
jgi:acetyl-CoA carboxylase biotin carboxyl carrier protein